MSRLRVPSMLDVSRFLFVLDTMWGWSKSKQAPDYFYINPGNYSGKRIHRWARVTALSETRIAVVNSCPEVAATASGRGKPDPVWLRSCLYVVREELPQVKTIVACGGVAQTTFLASWFPRYDYRVVFAPHPAARFWTNEAIERFAKLLCEGTADLRCSIVEGRLKAVEL